MSTRSDGAGATPAAQQNPAQSAGDAVEPSQRGRLSAPFRDRNFRLLWAGSLVSNLGNAMYKITLAWAVYQLTGSSSALGLVLAANIIPQLTLTVGGGALADQLPRRTIILVCDLVAGGITGALAVAALFDRLSLPVLVVAAFGLGLVSAFFGPAYNPLFRAVLDVDQQQAASAVMGASNNSISIIGPGLAALIFAVSTAATGFAINAASFFISAGCTALCVLKEDKAAYTGALLGEIRRGLAYVVGTQWLRTAMVLSLVANLACVGPLYVLLPSLVRNAGGGGSLLGAVTAVQAASTALFAIVIGKLAHRVPRGVAMCTLAAITGGGIALLGASAGRAGLIVASMVVIGLGFAFNVLEVVMIQELVPYDYLSRVYSINIVVSFAAAPITYAASGAIASAVGSGSVLVVGGSTLAVVALLLGASTRWNVVLDPPAKL